MLSKGFVIVVIVIVILAIISAFYFAKCSKEQDWKIEQSRLSEEMESVAIVATVYAKKNGNFPSVVDAALEAAIEKNFLDRLRSSGVDKPEVESSNGWLVCRAADNDKQAIDEATKIRPRQVLYCLIREGNRFTGFRVLAKDSSGKLVRIHRHNPLMFNERDFSDYSDPRKITGIERKGRAATEFSIMLLCFIQYFPSLKCKPSQVSWSMNFAPKLWFELQSTNDSFREIDAKRDS
jgi:Tfp pilus assembly protein FimT